MEFFFWRIKQSISIHLSVRLSVANNYTHSIDVDEAIFEQAGNGHEHGHGHGHRHGHGHGHGHGMDMYKINDVFVKLCLDSVDCLVSNL